MADTTPSNPTGRSRPAARPFTGGSARERTPPAFGRLAQSDGRRRLSAPSTFWTGKPVPFYGPTPEPNESRCVEPHLPDSSQKRQVVVTDSSDLSGPWTDVVSEAAASDGVAKAIAVESDTQGNPLTREDVPLQEPIWDAATDAAVPQERLRSPDDDQAARAREAHATTQDDADGSAVLLESPVRDLCGNVDAPSTGFSAATPPFDGAWDGSSGAGTAGRASEAWSREPAAGSQEDGAAVPESDDSAFDNMATVDCAAVFSTDTFDAGLGVGRQRVADTLERLAARVREGDIQVVLSPNVGSETAVLASVLTSLLSDSR